MKERIAFVGTGVMGASMAGHLLRAGYPLTVHNRTRERAQGLLDQGARWAESPGVAARDADVLISIVGYPKDVESVYLQEGGILGSLKPGALVVDMTTSSPTLAVQIAAAAAQRKVDALDAPVSGGDLGARAGTLSIMVGGDRPAFERALPVFEAMGKNIVHQGGPGSGQHAKMCNQIAVAGGMVAIAECLGYASKSGLDVETVLASVSAGAAGSWSMSNLAPRALKGDYAPGFFVKHFIKDIGIAVESAEKMGLELPGLAVAKRLYEQLAAKGCEDDGTHALFRLFLDRDVK